MNVNGEQIGPECLLTDNIVNLKYLGEMKIIDKQTKVKMELYFIHFIVVQQLQYKVGRRKEGANIK